MCHPDQQVTAELAKRAEGIWPMPGQILVGGGFLLFDSAMVNASGLVASTEKVSTQNPHFIFVMNLGSAIALFDLSSTLSYRTLFALKWTTRRPS
jgi:hypothetical protein